MSSEVPARLAPLLAQYEFALDRLLTRLGGLRDAEYLWEPAAGCWSVRPRTEQRTSLSYGADWVLEFERGAQEPGPLTTLAWRIVHLASGLAMRADYTTGTKSLSYDNCPVPGNAARAVQALTDAGAAWHTILCESTDAHLDQVGRSSFPQGLDPKLPFLDVCWWVNQEVLHHGGEIGVLRDLFAAQRRM